MKVPNFALIFAIFATFSAQSDERWHWERALVVDAVSISVVTVSYNELLRKAHGMRWDTHTIRLTHNHGYAELFRNKATGGFTCRIYLTIDAKPEYLEHEQRHCHGWVHD